MKSIAVIGLGQFGHQIALSLSQKGFQVIALDKNPDVISEIKDAVSEAIIIDSTDEKAMWAVNIDTVDEAIVAIGSNMQSSLLTTALLQRMNIEEIHVRAISLLQESILKSMGIKNIVNIEKQMGIQVANIMSSEFIGKYVEISDRHSLMEISVPDPLIGKNLKDLNFRTKYRINIVGIKSKKPIIQEDGEVIYKTAMTDVPDPKYPLQPDDILVVAGTDDNLNRFLRMGKDEE